MIIETSEAGKISTVTEKFEYEFKKTIKEHMLDTSVSGVQKLILVHESGAEASNISYTLDVKTTPAAHQYKLELEGDNKVKVMIFDSGNWKLFGTAGVDHAKGILTDIQPDATYKNDRFDLKADPNEIDFSKKDRKIVVEEK